ncbi:MAG TPA: hypothetical protein VK645_04025 [Chitinophagaceae bacterium]|nr:hypothetical protein [Chitinophagaceae bacterium]
MKPFITLAIAIIVFNAAFAGSGNPSNVAFPKTFTSVLKEKKSLFEVETAKVCACQILRVASNNENETLVAVFAQGTNNGDLSANFATAISVLEKEKKHMKAMFYTKIKTAENVTAATPCSKLYKNIQVKYASVKMYDVLDADALSLVTKNF